MKRFKRIVFVSMLILSIIIGVAIGHFVVHSDLVNMVRFKDIAGAYIGSPFVMLVITCAIGVNIKWFKGIL